VKLIVLFNPAAGGGKARRALGEALEVLRRAGVNAQVRESRNAEHLQALARQAIEERPDVVVSAGGDGTHHYVLNGLGVSGIALGLIPLGRGNDFPKGVGIPLEPRAAAAVLLHGKTRSVDLARVGSVTYAGVAGVGFDSVVTRYANERVRWRGGRLSYAWAIFRCLKFYRPEPLELISDELNFAGDVILAVVGNNASYGGGFRLTPRAQLDDGLLDVCIVPAMSKAELLRWVPRAYRGEHLAHPRITYFQTRKVTLKSSSRLELFGDGEFLQELPATIEALPGAVRLLTPRSARPAAPAASS
jgi:diacylglycerol kinase (ATP)